MDLVHQTLIWFLYHSKIMMYLITVRSLTNDVVAKLIDSSTSSVANGVIY